MCAGVSERLYPYCEGHIPSLRASIGCVAKEKYEMIDLHRLFGWLQTIDSGRGMEVWLVMCRRLALVRMRKVSMGWLTGAVTVFLKGG